MLRARQDQTISTNAEPRSVARFPRRILGVLGVILLVLGIIVLYRSASPNGQDFRVCYYPLAARFARGQSPYVLEGDPLRVTEAARGEAQQIVLNPNPYPPFTAIAFCPFTLFPEPIARHIWLTLSLIVFFAGVWLALKVIEPEWSVEMRLLLLGITACAGSVRWCVGQYQAALLVAGLLGIFLYAEIRGRSGQALACAVLMTLKASLLVPVVLLWAFRKRYRQLAAFVLLTLILNVAGLARTGVAQTFAGWRLNMANYAVRGSNNYPDTRQHVKFWRGERYDIEMMPGVAPYENFNYTSQFTHWVFLLSAYTPNMASANRLAGLCSIAALLFLWLLWRHARPGSEDEGFLLEFFAVGVALTPLIFTHLKYDAVVLIFPFFIGLRSLPTRRARGGIEIVVLLASCFLVAFVAFSKIETVSERLVLATNFRGFIPIYSYGCTLAFLAAAVCAWRYKDNTQAGVVDAASSDPAAVS